MTDEAATDQLDNSDNGDSSGMLTFGEHLEVLRRMIFRIIAVVFVLATLIFCFKKQTFSILLAPDNSEFITFRIVEKLLNLSGIDFQLAAYKIPLINTDLSAQFMTHITVSCALGVLFSSPYILYELIRFISPALYDNERKYSFLVGVIIYILFLLGVLMNYFVIFPISFQFLANYQVDDSVINTITLESYISTFTTLTFIMGIVFQLPVIAYILGKIGFIDSDILKEYRPYAFIIIMIIAAVITPPDIFTLILVTFPIYGLYEISILILNHINQPKL